MEKYALEVQIIQPIDEGWKAQTDKGNKKVLFFNSQQQLALSHGWRESLANHGYRYVERYFATVDGKRWVEGPKGLYALSDYWEPRDWPGEKKKRIEGYERMGELLALIHTYFERAEGSKINIQERKGMLSRIRFQPLYDFLREINGNGKGKLPASTNRFLSANLPMLGERIHKAELFYQKGISQAPSYSLASISLDSLIWHNEKWFLTGLHHSAISRRHEDTFYLLIQIFRREKGQLKGIESFLKSYLSIRYLSPMEWEYLLSLLIFPWETVEQLYGIFKMKNLENITVEDVAHIFQKQMEQESILHFIARWADLRDGVTI